MKQFLHTFLRNVVGAVLFLLVMTALPTGWLYDLWAGTGTEQGQKPGEGVELLQRREDIENFFHAKTPATVSGGELAACPLARLRDAREEGTHYYHRGRAKRSVYISEYITVDYPIPVWQRVLQGFIAGGSYNRYYLTELGDGSWLCVYFDDYLALTGTDTLPAGYIRYGTNAEQVMLRRMAADYDVTPDYVLDMYRHGKVHWMLDTALRFGVLIAVFVVAVTVREHWKGEENAGDSQAGT